MCVVSHSYGGLGGVWMGVVVGKHCRTKPGGVDNMSGDAGALPECDV